MARALSIEKRERFLTAALKLFVANGIQNTSTAEISREAGTAAGTLFLYFSTKQGLIDELVLWIAKKEAAVINGLLTPSPSVRETFFIIWDGSIRWLLENMDAYRYSQQVRDSSLVTPAVAQESGKYFAFYYDAIQKGLEAGLLKPYPADLIGGFLYQDIVATMDHLRAQADPQQLAQTIQQGFDLFWDGISISK